MDGSLLINLLQVSLTTGVVIALVLVFLPLFRKRYAAKWRYCVWLLLAVRLLIPFSPQLPKAPVQIALPSAFTAGPVQSSGLSQNAPGPQATSATGQANAKIPATKAQVAAPQNVEAKPPRFTLGPTQWALGIWAAGFAVSLILRGAVYIAFCRKLKYSPRAQIPARVEEVFGKAAEGLAVARLPRLQICSAVPAPLLMGLLRPVLLLPHSRYGRRELALILRHELVHYRRRDLWYKLLMNLAACVHWFNPLVYAMGARAGRDIELACDDRVVQGLDEEERDLYGRTILQAVPLRRGPWAAPVFTSCFGSTKQGLAQRMKNLFDKTSKKRGMAALCVTVLAAGLVGSLVACAPSSADTTPQNTGAGAAALASTQKDAPFALYAGYGLRYDEAGDQLYYQDTPVRYFEDDGIFYNGDGSISGAFVAHYPKGDAGEIDLYAVRSNSKKLMGLRMADTDEYDNLTYLGVKMREDIAPYAALGLSVNAIGTMFYSGSPVRELYDEEKGTLITHSMGASYPEGSLDLAAVYDETGGLQALRVLSQQEYDAQTARRIANVQNHWLAVQGGTALPGEEDLISFESVELRQYSDGGLYIHDILENGTGKTIAAYQQGMLAFDEAGQPLKLKWYPFNEEEPGYYYLYDWAEDVNIPAGSRYDEEGGWSLTEGGGFGEAAKTPEAVEKVRYVLYTMKQVTFTDGTVWVNPAFELWRKTYEGKPADVNDLESYYPHSMLVEVYEQMPIQSELGE